MCAACGPGQLNRSRGSAVLPVRAAVHQHVLVFQKYILGGCYTVPGLCIHVDLESALQLTGLIPVSEVTPVIVSAGLPVCVNRAPRIFSFSVGPNKCYYYRAADTNSVAAGWLKLKTNLLVIAYYYTIGSRFHWSCITAGRISQVGLWGSDE